MYQFKQDLFELFNDNASETEDEQLEYDHRREQIENDRRISFFSNFEESRNIFRHDRAFTKLHFLLCTKNRIAANSQNALAEKKSHQEKISTKFL